MAPPTQQPKPKSHAYLDTMALFIRELFDEDWFHWTVLSCLSQIYHCIANEPCFGGFNLLCFFEEDLPDEDFSTFGQTWSAHVEDKITQLRKHSSSDFQILKLAIPDNYTERESSFLKRNYPKAYKDATTWTPPHFKMTANIHKWIFMIALHKEWGLSTLDCKAIFADSWDKAPLAPELRHVLPSKLTSTAYLRSRLASSSPCWTIPAPRSAVGELHEEGLFQTITSIRIFYEPYPDPHYSSAVTHIDLIFFRNAEYGAKKVLVLSNCLWALFLVRGSLPYADNLERGPDYGIVSGPWSSQLLRLLLVLVSTMRERRLQILAEFETQFESLSGFEQNRTPRRNILELLSKWKKDLHSMNFHCSGNKQAISSLLHKVDHTPSLAASESDRAAIEELHLIALDLEHLGEMLRKLESGYQDLGERVGYYVIMKQHRLIMLLYTLVCAGAGRFLLSNYEETLSMIWGSIRDVEVSAWKTRSAEMIISLYNSSLHLMSLAGIPNHYEFWSELGPRLVGTAFSLIVARHLFELRPFYLLILSIAMIIYDFLEASSRISVS